jgi:hypothetical protein
MMSRPLSPETHKEILKRGLLSTRTTIVKAGIYQLRMFVRETETGRIGTANNYVEIPDLKGDRLSMSSISSIRGTMRRDGWRKI